MRFLGDDPADASLHKGLELYGTSRQVLDTDGWLAAVHVGEGWQRIHGELNLPNNNRCTKPLGIGQTFIVLLWHFDNIISVQCMLLTSSPTLNSWPRRNTSAKWKNMVCSRSTHRMKPKPSLKEQTMPCSRLVPTNI